jgi:hypothetical protein
LEPKSRTGKPNVKASEMDSVSWTPILALQPQNARKYAGWPDGIFSYQKSQYICVYFGVPFNGRCWHILWSFGIF